MPVSKSSNIGENPNDKMPPGKPLGHDEIASDDGDDDFATQKRASDEDNRPAVAPELQDVDNDLVNLGKFIDPVSDIT